MKKNELDLTKAHVDNYKADEPKAYNGAKLAMTEAGWATVTTDGTIIEVLDAFPGKKSAVRAAFDARNELSPTLVLDETILINPIDISSDGSAANSEVIDSTPPVLGTFLYTADSSFIMDTSVVTIASAGSEQTDGVYPLTITAPDATSATVDGSGITHVTGDPVDGTQAGMISAGGSGYSSAPTIAQTSGPGTGASFVAVITAGVVTDITTAGAGAGYDGTETYTITAPDSTQAAGEATIVGGEVTGVSITTDGEGYIAGTVTL